MVKPQELSLYDEASFLIAAYKSKAKAGEKFDGRAVLQLAQAAEVIAKERLDVAIANGWCPNDCGPMKSRSSYGADKYDCEKCGYKYRGCEACE